jgi:hypothetical protein
MLIDILKAYAVVELLNNHPYFTPRSAGIHSRAWGKTRSWEYSNGNLKVYLARIESNPPDERYNLYFYCRDDDGLFDVETSLEDAMEIMDPDAQVEFLFNLDVLG